MSKQEDKMPKRTRAFKDPSKNLNAYWQAASSQEMMNGISEVFKSLEQNIEQNRIIFKDLIPVNAIYDPMIDRIISSSIDASNILYQQMQSIDLKNLYLSPALEEANAVNLSIGRFIGEINGIQKELIKQIQPELNMWDEQLRSIERIMGEFPRLDLALISHLAEISKLSVLSQTTLSRFPWENFGNVLDLQTPFRMVLQDNFLDFAQSYSKLFDFWEKQPLLLLSLPPILSRYPAIEFFNGADIIDAITVRDQEDLELHKEEQRNKKYKREETEDRLEVLLIRLDPEFVVPLRGARQSIDSKNPDHVRHFATSLRELFTHVLHTLATDEKVMAWSTSSEHYHNGKPTRRVRLLYICQNLNQEPFSAFLEKDIDAGLAFLKLFQGGTHKIAPRYTDSQLRIMLIRMEYLLTFILETWSLDK